MKLPQNLMKKLSELKVEKSAQITADFKSLHNDLNLTELYGDIYKVIPNTHFFLGIGSLEFLTLLLEKFEDFIIDYSFRVLNAPHRNITSYNEFIFHLKPDLLIRIDKSIGFAYKNTESSFIEADIFEIIKAEDGQSLNDLKLY